MTWDWCRVEEGRADLAWIARGAAPASLMGLLGLLGQFRGCFTAPSFTVFCALASGFVAQTGRRTVCGMLVGPGLSRVWSHLTPPVLLSHARWSPQQQSVVVMQAIRWYATTGYHPDDVTADRASPKASPLVPRQGQPSVADMLTKLRRVIIASQFRPATPTEMNIVRLAGQNAAA